MLSFNTALTRPAPLKAITEITVYINILPRLKGIKTVTDSLILLEFFTKSGLRNGMHENIHAVLP